MQTFEEYQFKIKHSNIQSYNYGKLSDGEMYGRVKLPIFNEMNKDHDIVYAGKCASVSLPINAKYVIWKDPYKGGKAHLTDIGDLFLQIGWQEIDFEDIDPSLFIAGFDSLRGAANWMIKNLNGDWADKDRFIKSAALGEQKEYDLTLEECIKEYVSSIDCHVMYDENGNNISDTQKELNDFCKKIYQLQ